jgi:thiol-disulfide isomerase/thioredoxin
MRGKSSRGSSSRGAGKANKLMKKLGLNKVNGETVVICVLLVVLLVLVVYYVRQNNEGFEASNSKRCNIYIFVADWCPHCKSAKPEIAALNNSPPDNAVVNVVNEKDENSRELMAKYNVKGFPTCVVHPEGEEAVELDKRVTAENITELVNKVGK